MTNTVTTTPLRYSAVQTVLTEIPGEVSLSFLITGCPLGCHGCHSKDSWDGQKGVELTPGLLIDTLAKAKPLISCVLFMGGEWNMPALSHLLQICKSQGLATALYTGLTECPAQLLPHLDYVKTGRWQAAKGGLPSKLSNQRLIDLRRQLCLNPLFWQPPQAAIPLDNNNKIGSLYANA